MISMIPECPSLRTPKNIPFFPPLMASPTALFVVLHFHNQHFGKQSPGQAQLWISAVPFG